MKSLVLLVLIISVALLPGAAFAGPTNCFGDDTPGLYQTVPVGSGANMLGRFLTLRTFVLADGVVHNSVFYLPGRKPVKADLDLDCHYDFGVYDNASGKFLFPSDPTASSSVIDQAASFRFGATGDDTIPLVGDWDGDGLKTVGLYDPTPGPSALGRFILTNTNDNTTPANMLLNFRWQVAGLVPIAGDWNGNGTDTIGVYHPPSGRFLLKNENDNVGGPDFSFKFGEPNLVPVVGDWDGDGTDTIGVYDPSNGRYRVRNSNTAGLAEVNVKLGSGGDVPISGNWDAR